MINKFVKFAQHHALKNSKKIILLAISITIFIGSGIRFILLDDNVMNMLPNNIESKRVWEDIVQEFLNNQACIRVYDQTQLLDAIEFFASNVKTIKKALELISEGIL